MRVIKWILLVVVILAIAYLLGPHPSTPVYSNAMPAVPAEPAALVNYIQQQEAGHKIKPDNEARVVWANDSLKNKTEYALVYLHGFTASQGEGDPVHRDLAKKFGCNLYLSRLAEHGIDTTEPMVNLTADNYWETAKEALAIGKQLGNKVILVGTSTGGTMALKLAAEYPDVYALILMSPNIEINDGTAWILNNPWGLQVARMVKGSKYLDSDDHREAYRKYWTYHYRIEAAVNLEELLETTMKKETFEKVKQPTLTLYYYKDAVHQDSTVKVSAIKSMFAQLGTPSDKKREVAMPNAGDHVIGSWIRSNDVPGVERETERFMTEVLGIKAL
ncbi:MULTISPECIES: alpha/beta hydrolase [Niastella]|uniref:Alpha/beta fold hydrolase n=1 Tax=Niastella soli TaxID=2821487 RepID=A0ABS3YPV9_9BACT|nr:alpha/beta fold hydrolase [Niastella soli]MBO9199928.1 alpha/beta fold hydrolase [Niastella soli]